MRQHALPSRVNIRLELDKMGQKEKVELPFNMLVIDDFNPGGKKQPLIEQERLSVNKKNVDEVMKKISPSLDLTVNNTLNPGEELAVHLTFEKMQDFRPENLVQNLPVLKKMLAMRLLLKELKSNINNSPGFRKILEKIMQNPGELALLKNEMNLKRGK